MAVGFSCRRRDLRFRLLRRLRGSIDRITATEAATKSIQLVSCGVKSRASAKLLMINMKT